MSDDPPVQPEPAPAIPPTPGDAPPSTDADHIPLEPHPADAIPVARPAANTGPSIDAKPILQLTSDVCPNCGSTMDADAVVCLVCGYDLKANRVINPVTGVEEIEPKAGAAGVDTRAEFVRPGGTPKLVGILGGIMLIGASVCAGFAAPAGSGFVVTAAMVVLTLYSGVLHTATGVAATWCAAKYVGERFTKIDLVAARMLLVFATFLLVLSVPAHLPYEWLDKGLKFVAATGTYFLMLMATFRRDRRVTLTLLAAHAAIWVFVQIGVLMGVVLQSMASAPASKP